jgi:hypothetical protein
MTGFVEHFQAAVESQLSEVNTVLPGEVVSWEPGRNRLVVRPVLPKALADGRSLDPPDIVEVPVAWPAAGGAIMTMPIKSGDGVMLLFAARSLEQWLNGDNVAPDDPRRFDLTDAIAIPGLSATGVTADPDAVEVRYDGSAFRLEPAGTVRLRGANFIVEMTSSVHITTPTTTHEGEIHQTGNIAQTGNHSLTGGVAATADVSAGTVSLKTHVHTASGGTGLGGPPAGA